MACSSSAARGSGCCAETPQISRSSSQQQLQQPTFIRVYSSLYINVHTAAVCACCKKHCCTGKLDTFGVTNACVLCGVIHSILSRPNENKKKLSDHTHQTNALVSVADPGALR